MFRKDVVLVLAVTFAVGCRGQTPPPVAGSRAFASPSGFCEQTVTLRTLTCPSGSDCTTKGTTLTHAELDAALANVAEICDAPIATSGLLNEGGQASVGAAPHFLGIADGSVASPNTDAQPTIVFQRTDATSGTGIPFQFTFTKTSGTGFHYPIHSFVRNQSNSVSDIVAVSGSAYAEPTPLVTSLAATPSGSGGTLATATYGYYATAVVGGTEIVASEHVDAAVTGPTGSVALTWTAVASATAYRIYRYVPAAPDTAPVYFETASTSLTDTGGAGTTATGPSQTLWGGWWRVEKSATADSGRLAGGESDIINNSGRDPGPRPDRAGSTIGHQWVSAGNADNSIGVHLTGESDSQFHVGMLVDTYGFDQIGIDFRNSDDTKPAVRLANDQELVARNAADTADVEALKVGTGNLLHLGASAATVDGTNQRLGVVTTSPDERLEIEETANASTVGLVENTDASGTGAIAIWRAQASTATVSMLAHGSGRTATRFGVTIGGYGEVLQTNGSGLLFGTSTAVPVIMGTAGSALMSLTAAGQVSFSSPRVDAPGTLTVADDGTGAAATATLTPTTASLILVTCNDANGCTITLGETGIVSGQVLRIINMSANASTFADTAGVSELGGAFAAGQYDSLSLVYATDRWVETGRSNN